MKILRYGGILLMALALCTCGVFADVRPPNTHETQQIATFTSLQNVGLVTESDSLVWRQSNEVLDANENYVVNAPEPNEGFIGDWTFVGPDFDPNGFLYTPGSGDFDFPYWPLLPLFGEGISPLS